MKDIYFIQIYVFFIEYIFWIKFINPLSSTEEGVSKYKFPYFGEWITRYTVTKAYKYNKKLNI